MAPRLRSPSLRSSRSSRPLRSSRMKVQSYYEESDSDDALDGRSNSDEELLGRTTASFRPRRSSHAPISYREDSTDDSLDEENDSRSNEIASLESTIHFTPPAFEPASNGTPSRVRRPPTGARGQTRRSTKSSNKRGLEIGRPLRKNKYQKIEAVEPLVGSGVIPPWQTLPYHVLFDIFFYASHPLVDKKGGIRLSSVQWLVNVALLCHAFLEPALAALYYSPPLIPVAKTHGLLSLLCRQQESLSINYANKIKVLDVDVEGVLAHKSGPLGYFELPRLIEATPQVKTLRLYHRNDYIVGLPHWQIPLSKWTYPEALFSSLNASSIMLHSWDWNGRFMDAEQVLPFIFTIHQQRAFRSLRELRLLHIAGPSFEEDSSVKQLTLAAALKQLPDLHRLEFRECSILDGHLLSSLPSGLTCLTIDNCDEVMTSDLEAFLASYGYNLRELNLNHNRNLSLSFLADLARFCGRLERLKMDLSMHDWSSDHDVEPHFDELLNPSEVPAWPPTLQDIEFIQLRKWDDATAEVFFTSLVHAAPYLRDLRRLVISAILRIGWRDRASFRERWIRRLETTFLRRSKPPDSNLTAVRQPAQPVLEGDMPTEDVAIPDAPTGNGVSSAHSTPSKRKSARLAQRRFLENEDQRDTRSVRSMSSSPTPNTPIQGMCDIVMIRIDNQRPTETQFNESDFLDEELSGDEDWTGRDLDIPDSHACNATKSDRNHSMPTSISISDAQPQSLRGERVQEKKSQWLGSHSRESSDSLSGNLTLLALFFRRSSILPFLIPRSLPCIYNYPVYLDYPSRMYYYHHPLLYIFILLHTLVAPGVALIHDDSFQPDYVLRITAQNYSLACIERYSVLVNGTSPGPELRLREGKVSWIRVYNDMTDNNFTMHWHGLTAFTAPFSDGTPLSSQWPIAPGYFFDYEVRPDIGSAGSYFYHSHVGFQAVSASGPLIVEDNEGSPYEYDEERTIYLSDLFMKTDSQVQAGLVSPNFTWSGETTDVLVNGKGRLASNATGSCRLETIRVESGKTYRLRVIGATALSFVWLGIQGHNVSIIEADGHYTKPLETSFLQVHGGQRYSVLLRTKSVNELRSSGKQHFYIQLTTLERPAVLTTFALLSYSEPPANLTEIVPSHPPLPVAKVTNGWLDYQLQPLFPQVDFPTLDEVTRRITITVHQNFSTQTQWLQNGYPWTSNLRQSPYLVDIYENRLDTEAVYQRAIASGNGFDNVTRAFSARLGEVLEIVWQNVGSFPTGGLDAHPLHAHGKHYYDIGGGDGEYDPVANEERLRNSQPTPRDTTVLYRYRAKTEPLAFSGWRAWRLRVTNAGVWMMHCHALQHMIQGMQTVWIMGHRDDILAQSGPVDSGYLTYGGSAYGNKTHWPNVSHYFGELRCRRGSSDRDCT